MNMILSLFQYFTNTYRYGKSVKFRTRIRKRIILFSYSLLYLMKGLKKVFCLAGFKITFSHPFIDVISPWVDLVNIFRSQIRYLIHAQNISMVFAQITENITDLSQYFPSLFKPFSETFQNLYLLRCT